jgi:hypothetical protein
LASRLSLRHDKASVDERSPPVSEVLDLDHFEPLSGDLGDQVVDRFVKCCCFYFESPVSVPQIVAPTYQIHGQNCDAPGSQTVLDLAKRAHAVRMQVGAR